MDNFYMNMDLMIYLRSKMAIETAGTFRNNRPKKCPLASEKALKKRTSII
jgi:hypothetical protein